MDLEKHKIHLFYLPRQITIVALFSVNVLLGSNFIEKFQAPLERTGEGQEKKTLMDGKKKTDLSITFNLAVEGSPDQIFNLCTTVSEIRKFFGTDAVVDLKPGDSYEIYFLPRKDPKSDTNSTKGTILLDIKKNEKLVFELRLLSRP